MAKKRDPWKGVTVIIEPPSDDVVNKARVAMYWLLKKKGEKSNGQNSVCGIPCVAGVSSR